jgi:tetratricopeptide (TPR) repeat protein/predicted Ser/Thr protein kinase
VRNPIPAECWASINSLFEEALNLPPSEREPFVRKACGDNYAVREEVLQLLAYDIGEDGDLLIALQEEAAALVADEPAEGMALGHWRVEREIGRGGMAVVYLGSRDDGAYRKQVAIKLIRRGMDTQSVVNRLRRERAILAALDHPWIARLLDGGAAPDGRPYIVMDYVEGLPITRYCDRHRLGVEARCTLLVKVCEAVAYAHRNLVVHRDLKPANIMVTEEGEPKLLDFGIAKLLTYNLEGDGPDTRLLRPLTPEYASPEQLVGAGVGTATDVYSLGVVAYELLAGERPGPSGEKASAVALRNGKGRRWARQLSGDLDNILQMALRPEPERRYLSIGQLQADLQLHLKGLPVAAREESALYRWGKFLARNRLGVAATVAMVLILSAGVAATLWEARRAEARRIEAEREAAVAAAAQRRAESEHAEAEVQRARAEAQREIADHRFFQVRDMAGRFLFDFHDAVAKLPGSTPVRKMVVDTGIRFYDSLVKDATGNNAPANRDLLEEIARGYDRLGDVQGNPYYSNLGDVAGAVASYGKAQAIRGKIVDGSPEFLVDRVLGQVRIGQMLQFQSRYDESTRVLKRAIALADRSNSKTMAVRDALATAWTILADSQARAADYPSALVSRTAALSLRQALVRESNGSVAQLRGLSLAETRLGEHYFRLEQPEPSLPHLLAAREIDQRLLAADPGNAALTRKLRVTDLLLGSLLYGSGKHLAKPGQATEILQEALRVCDRALAADPANTQAQEDLAITATALGESLRADRDFKGARAVWEKGMGVALKLPAASANDGILSQLYRRIGIAFSDEGQLEPALENLRKAEEHALAAEKNAKTPAAKLIRLGDVSETRSDIYAAAKRWAEAIAELKANIADYDELAELDPGNPQFTDGQPATYAKLAGLYASAGDGANQRRALQTAIGLFAKIEAGRPLSTDEKKTRDEARDALSGLLQAP